MSVPVPPDDSASGPAPDAAAPAAVVEETESPPRAVWTSVQPSAPWIPDEWHAALRRRVPGWSAREHDRLDGGETASMHWHSAEWTVVAASRRGRLHAHRGEYREDAIASRALHGGWCGAVADGAGSATWSRVGAAVATQLWCELIAGDTAPLADRARLAAHGVFEILSALADEWGIAPRTLRTTLLGVAVEGDELVTMQVGDGGVVLFSANDVVSAPQTGHAGEFSGDVTLFLPDRDSGVHGANSVVVASSGAVDALLLATDGIEDPWYPLERHARALRASLDDGVSDERSQHVAAQCGVTWQWRGDVCAAVDAGVALTNWMTFEKRGENDDRSLLYARRRR